MRLAVVVGNPKPHSRTRQVAELLASRVAQATGATPDLTIDLCDFSESVFRWPDDRLDALTEQIASAQVVIVATPTYKASYTGLLKAFLDRYPSNGLMGVIAIPLMTIASAAHSLAVEYTLRPLLVELGASVPTRGLSFMTPQMDDAEFVVDEWLAVNRSYLGGAMK